MYIIKVMFGPKTKKKKKEEEEAFFSNFGLENPYLRAKDVSRLRIYQHQKIKTYFSLIACLIISSWY